MLFRVQYDSSLLSCLLRNDIYYSPRHACTVQFTGVHFSVVMWCHYYVCIEDIIFPLYMLLSPNALLMLFW